MSNQFSRTETLLGTEALNKVQGTHIAIFGLGGVGGYTLEALARSGVQNFDIIDNDIINLTNLNRQIIALHSTIGKQKTEAWKERLLDINPNIKITIHNKFCTKENIIEFDFKKYDYIIDAIDTVSAKIAIIEQAKSTGTPIISAMGAGNKINPFLFEITDISKTSICPLAKAVRTELKKKNIKNVKVIYSKELPFKSNLKDKITGKPIPSSCAFVPSVCGLMIASEVIKDIIE